ncbi:MAG: nicotinate phosphoribosyltransferase [Leptospiraceae bacterium]|nr:nicotinate phosphoribosyltransferase [Leptospiraceae bacterium]
MPAFPDQPPVVSLLDTDFYKLTMQQAVWHQFRTARAGYRFYCRSPVDLSPLISRIRAQVRELDALRLQSSELDYLQATGLFADDYLKYLHHFRFDSRQVHIRAGESQLEIQIVGPWCETILFEVPVLAIINETWFRHLRMSNAHSVNESEDRGDWAARRRLYAEGLRRLRAGMAPIQSHAELRMADFGTRRRYSRHWHAHLLNKIAAGRYRKNIAGTSNVDLARRTGLTPVGTMAHEYIQACQAFTDLRSSQRFALESWLREYDGRLGIALSDVVTRRVFLRDFDGRLARRYRGVRQDSGDPFEWGELLVRHYQKLGIDPLTKQLVFSDGLDYETVLRIFRHFEGRVGMAFGIGTHLTNNLGPDALNIVIKLTHMNGQPVAKITDDPAKVVAPDDEYL